MNPDRIKAILEAAIFISSEPVSIERLAMLFTEEERPNNQDLRVILQGLEQEYSNRSIELKKVASGYRFQVREEVAIHLGRWLDNQPSRYSRALLETLALIAYKQPITRAGIEEVRGVSISSNILRTLQERDWIKAVGHRDVPGKPILYATTVQFLNDFNLQNLSQLPELLETQEEEGAAQLGLAFKSMAEASAQTLLELSTLFPPAGTVVASDDSLLAETVGRLWAPSLQETVAAENAEDVGAVLIPLTKKTSTSSD